MLALSIFGFRHGPEGDSRTISRKEVEWGVPGVDGVNQRLGIGMPKRGSWPKAFDVAKVTKMIQSRQFGDHEKVVGMILRVWYCAVGRREWIARKIMVTAF